MMLLEFMLPRIQGVEHTLLLHTVWQANCPFIVPHWCFSSETHFPRLRPLFGLQQNLNNHMERKTIYVLQESGGSPNHNQQQTPGLTSCRTSHSDPHRPHTSTWAAMGHASTSPTTSPPWRTDLRCRWQCHQDQPDQLLLREENAMNKNLWFHREKPKPFKPERKSISHLETRKYLT